NSRSVSIPERIDLSTSFAVSFAFRTFRNDSLYCCIKSLMISPPFMYKSRPDYLGGSALCTASIFPPHSHFIGFSATASLPHFRHCRSYILFTSHSAQESITGQILPGVLFPLVSVSKSA